MYNIELTEAINAITTDWELRGPYHEDGYKHHALLRGEWVGNGYTTKLQALRAIYEQLRGEKELS